MNQYLNEKHYVYEYGNKLYVDCGIDVSEATNITVVFKRPDGSIFTLNAEAVIYNDSSHWVVCTIAEGSFIQAGQYVGQVHLTLGTWEGPGEKFTIDVEDPVSSSSSSSRSSSSSSSTA